MLSDIENILLNAVSKEDELPVFFLKMYNEESGKVKIKKKKQW